MTSALAILPSRLTTAAGTRPLLLLRAARRVTMVIALAVALAACSAMVAGPGPGVVADEVDQPPVSGVDDTDDDPLPDEPPPEESPAPGPRPTPDPCRTARPPGPC
jgi:hypothetical protein